MSCFTLCLVSFVDGVCVWLFGPHIDTDTRIDIRTPHIIDIHIPHIDTNTHIAIQVDDEDETDEPNTTSADYIYRLLLPSFRSDMNLLLNLVRLAIPTYTDTEDTEDATGASKSESRTFGALLDSSRTDDVSRDWFLHKFNCNFNS